MQPAPAQQQITFVYCPDLETSARFYSETLGLPLVLDQGACRIYRVAEGAFVGVCSCGEAQSVVPEGITITLVSEEVDAWHAHLAAAGVPIEAPPRYNERFRIYNFFARDPAGYRIEIQRFDRPDWMQAAENTVS